MLVGVGLNREVVVVAGVFCGGSSVGDRVLPGLFLFGWVRNRVLRFLFFVITMDQRRKVWLYKLKSPSSVGFTVRTATSTPRPPHPLTDLLSLSNPLDPRHVTTIKLVASVSSLYASI